MPSIELFKQQFLGPFGIPLRSGGVGVTNSGLIHVPACASPILETVALGSSCVQLGDWDSTNRS